MGVTVMNIQQFRQRASRELTMGLAKRVMPFAALLSFLIPISTALAQSPSSPISPEDYMKLGAADTSAGDFDLAITDYSKAIELRPGLTDAYYRRGIVYGKKGDYDKAIADYNKAIEIDPAKAEFYNHRGTAQANKADFDQAINDYTRAIQLKPDYSEAYGNRGIAYHNTRDYDRAIGDFNTSIQLKPGVSAAYYNRGKAYAEKGDPKQAIADATKAIELKPDNAGAYALRAQAYSVSNDYKRANTDCLKAMKFNPSFGNKIWREIGWIEYKAARYKNAILSFHNAMELDDQDVATQFNLALACAASGDWEAAEPEYMVGLGIAHQKDTKLAFERIMEALKLDPRSKALKSALALLQTSPSH